MKRPSDQVKLLFVGFLRTASALASSDSKFGAAAALSTSSHHHHHHVYYNANNNPAPPVPPLLLRVARAKDVNAISACNIATLPENYNTAFYTNHIRQWPDLAIVAVLDDNTERREVVHDENEDFRPTLHLNYHPSTSSSYSSNSDNNVVAYVLGKVEERMVPINNSYDNDLHSLMGRPQQYTTEFIGHVTSLAVLEPFRRRGLAAELMNQLHYHLEQHTNAVTVCGLHVRKSNIAATQLYERFGYCVTETIPCYYQDGEDAYYMTRPISPSPPSIHADPTPNHREDVNRAGFLGNIMFGRRQNNNNNRGSTSFFLRHAKQPWEFGPPHLRLPRPVGRREPNRTNRDDNTDDHSKHNTNVPELMTGTM